MRNKAGRRPGNDERARMDNHPGPLAKRESDHIALIFSARPDLRFAAWFLWMTPLLAA